jgi:hypothetical protein
MSRTIRSGVSGGVVEAPERALERDRMGSLVVHDRLAVGDGPHVIGERVGWDEVAAPRRRAMPGVLYPRLVLTKMGYLKIASHNWRNDDW